MSDIIKCPACGKSNLPDQDVCQYCQTRLPDTPIKPGQIPTKKNTAELEPILPQWLRDARDSAREDDQQEAQQKLDQPESLQSQAASSTNDLLAGLQSQAGNNDEGEMPDWLASIMEAPSNSTKSQTESSDTDRIEQGGRDDFENDVIAELSPDEEIPSWLAELKLAESQPNENDEANDWLHDLERPEQVRQFEQPESFESSFTDSSTSDTPDWLRAMRDQEEAAKSADSAGYSGSGFGESEAAESPANGDLTDWMDSLPKDEETKQGATPVWLSNDESLPLSSTAEPGDNPDWLNSFQAVPAFQPETPFAPADSPPPATPEDSQTNDNVDALFTDMPDWLSNASEAPPSSNLIPNADMDEIAPGDLPDWVQAMQPADSGDSQLSSSMPSPGDQSLETQGALAWLQGVLPAAPGFAPTSKPKAYSIKLQASDEQQAHAALLEKILAAETAPIPIASFSALRTSRSLRWFLAFIIFVIIGIPLFMRTQIFSLPEGVPLSVKGAMQVAQSIPEGAPVLVAFDYEPARVGEMEAAAAPLFDQLMLLRHPHLILISTNATGAILAERFISGPLAVHDYQYGIQYLNLGYLPGGQMGIRAFTQNPRVTVPLDMSLSSAWDSAPLEEVASLSQFAILIIVTDDADAARTWIEQTESARGDIPLVVISSAQAAPMIQPYFESQQVSGLISGLYGGALFEQYNAGRPGTARSYWDAYSLGMLLAMALVFGGGLWNFFLGLRDRAAIREAQ
ncbi:MAG: hypothetical protein ACYC6R_06370 [Anaerolineales bacterium]